MHELGYVGSRRPEPQTLGRCRDSPLGTERALGTRRGRCHAVMWGRVFQAEGIARAKALRWGCAQCIEGSEEASVAGRVSEGQVGEVEAERLGFFWLLL